MDKLGRVRLASSLFKYMESLPFDLNLSHAPRRLFLPSHFIPPPNSIELLLNLYRFTLNSPFMYPHNLNVIFIFIFLNWVSPYDDGGYPNFIAFDVALPPSPLDSHPLLFLQNPFHSSLSRRIHICFHLATQCRRWVLDFPAAPRFSIFSPAPTHCF